MQEGVLLSHGDGTGRGGGRDDFFFFFFFLSFLGPQLQHMEVLRLGV